MSDSAYSRSSTDGEPPRVPRATIHKQILDAAAEEPEASMETIADRVSGASLGLVEQVLDKYGDPADSQASETASETGDNATENDSSMELSDQKTAPDGEPPVELSELTEKQRETIEAIAENPHATQSELADEFEVSAATINNRVNTIPGFEWKLRHQFIDTMLDDDTASANGGDQGPDPTEDKGGDDLAEKIMELETRIERLEQPEAGRDENTLIDDTELLHKLIHASMDSDRITEDEELRILEELLGSRSS